jgi:hypothetical protein
MGAQQPDSHSELLEQASSQVLEAIFGPPFHHVFTHHCPVPQSVPMRHASAIGRPHPTVSKTAVSKHFIVISWFVSFSSAAHTRQVPPGKRLPRVLPRTQELLGYEAIPGGRAVIWRMGWSTVPPGDRHPGVGRLNLGSTEAPRWSVWRLAPARAVHRPRPPHPRGQLHGRDVATPSAAQQQIPTSRSSSALFPCSKRTSLCLCMRTFIPQSNASCNST